MIKTRLCILGVLIVCLGLQECFASRDVFLNLYLGRSYDIKVIGVLSDTPDLSTKDFDNQAHSYYIHGTAILYDLKNYNDGNPYEGIITMTYTSTGFTGGTTENIPTLSKTSSVRILGSNSGSTHYPSITLFGKINFGGLQKELITSSKPSLSYYNSVSLVNIGVYDWTFYDEVNFNGIGNCVKGSSSSQGVRFLADSTAIGFSLQGKKSVERGCWARHGVPLED